MTFRIKLFWGLLAVILLTSGSLLYFDKKSNVYDTTTQNYKKGVNAEVDRAVGQAKLIYAQKRQQGLNLSSGPCLSNDLQPGWVADLVHNPRAPVDNLPQNQCSTYLSGRATHFVELDLDGNLVRVH